MASRITINVWSSDALIMADWHKRGQRMKGRYNLPLQQPRNQTQAEYATNGNSAHYRFCPEISIERAQCCYSWWLDSHTWIPAYQSYTRSILVQLRSALCWFVTQSWLFLLFLNQWLGISRIEKCSSAAANIDFWSTALTSLRTEPKLMSLCWTSDFGAFHNTLASIIASMEELEGSAAVRVDLVELRVQVHT